MASYSEKETNDAIKATIKAMRPSGPRADTIPGAEPLRSLAQDSPMIHASMRRTPKTK